MKRNNILVVLVCIVMFFLFIMKYYDEIKIWILNRVIVKRGILSINCPWFRVSDFLLNDTSGVDLYNEMKRKHGDFPLTTQFNEQVYLVTNVSYLSLIHI